MRINTRLNPNTSVAGLISELIDGPGDCLILASGYMRQDLEAFAPNDALERHFSVLDELPDFKMVSKFKHVLLILGQHRDGATFSELESSCDRFAMWLRAEADVRSISTPADLSAYIIPTWHAKIALTLSQNTGEVHGAVIGSSNLTRPATEVDSRKDISGMTIEVDVLIRPADGPDAQTQLNKLYASVRDILSQNQTGRLKL